MVRFIAMRLLTMVPTVLAVLAMVFILVRIVPGDPALVILGDQADPQAIARFRAQTGLDQPILTQFVVFLGSVLQGDLGVSMITRRPVIDSMRRSCRSRWNWPLRR